MLPHEDELILLLTKQLTQSSSDVIIGIGDDTAVLKYNDEFDLIFTTDSFVHEVHFNLNYMTPQDIGWKALAVNLSDIAAMGGQPIGALVSLLIPNTINDSAFIELIYQGLNHCSTKYSCPIIGGNISSSTQDFVLDISMLGKVPKGKAWFRSKAKVGDYIAVTGPLGSSNAGFQMLTKGAFINEVLKNAHCQPKPRIDLVPVLHQSLIVNAAMDISDGLSTDLNRLCKASNVGANLNGHQIPIAPETIKYSQQQNINPLILALNGGEDYELLLTLAELPIQPIPELFIIGHITKSTSVLLDGMILPPAGWDHIQPRT